MARKNNFLSASLLFVMACLCIGGNAARADYPPATAIVSPAVEQNGVRFETWLATPRFAIPDKSTRSLLSKRDYTYSTYFSVRVTNLTNKLLRFNQFAIYLRLIGPMGKELVPDAIDIAGYLRQRQEADYLMLAPGQSAVVPQQTFLFWQRSRLCLSVPSGMEGHPWVYEGLTVGSYQFRLRCTMPSPTVPIRDDHTWKIVKTLNGFWTGDITTPPLKFELVPHL